MIESLRGLAPLSVPCLWGTEGESYGRTEENNLFRGRSVLERSREYPRAIGPAQSI